MAWEDNNIVKSDEFSTLGNFLETFVQFPFCRQNLLSQRSCRQNILSRQSCRQNLLSRQACRQVLLSQQAYRPIPVNMNDVTIYFELSIIQS